MWHRNGEEDWTYGQHLLFAAVVAAAPNAVNVAWKWYLRRERRAEREFRERLNDRMERAMERVAPDDDTE